MKNLGIVVQHAAGSITYTAEELHAFARAEAKGKGKFVGYGVQFSALNGSASLVVRLEVTDGFNTMEVSRHVAL